MKKIPTLFQRDETDRSRVLPVVTPGCEWVLAGDGIPTTKYDGTACMVWHRLFYKRHVVKGGKTPPPGFDPSQPEPDPITGHWPGWVPVGEGPEDRRHREGYARSVEDRRACEWDEDLTDLTDGTYELCGPQVNGNPHGFEGNLLVPHGLKIHPAASVPRDFDGLKRFLADFPYEGIVWWHEDGRRAKIKRRDMGLPWPLPQPEETD